MGDQDRTNGVFLALALGPARTEKGKQAGSRTFRERGLGKELGVVVNLETLGRRREKVRRPWEGAHPVTPS